MLFDTNICTAVKCLNCGSLVIKDVSLFDLYKSGGHEDVCACGKTILKIKSNDCKTFCVYIPCAACEKEHLYIFNSRQVLSKKIKILGCPVSHVDLAFIGNRLLVREVAEKYERDLQELINVLEG